MNLAENHRLSGNGGQDLPIPSRLTIPPTAQISSQAAPTVQSGGGGGSQSGSVMEQPAKDTAVHTMPLPQGWEMAYDPETRRPYFVNHVTRETQWFDPRDVFTKPATFADCIGNELPVGWEQAHHSLLGSYFIDHNRRVNQLNDPRLEWLSVQADMVIGYLEQANNTNQITSTTVVPNAADSNAQNQIYSNTTRQVVFVPGATVIPLPEQQEQQSQNKENDYMNHKDIAAALQANHTDAKTTSTNSLENSSSGKVVLQFDDNSDYAVIDYPGGTGSSSMYEQIRTTASTAVTASAMIVTTPSVSTSSISNLSNHSQGSHYGHHHARTATKDCVLNNAVFSQATAGGPPQPRPRTTLGHQIQQQQQQPAVATTTNSSCSSSPTGNNQQSTDGAYHRNTFLLQQSLTEAKQRVAQLKRELGGAGSLSSPGSSSSNLTHSHPHPNPLHQHDHQNSSGSSNNDYNHNHSNNNNVLTIIDKYYTKTAGPNKHRSDPIQV